MATLSVCVGCKDLLFFLKMKDECLTVPYIYVPSKTSREFENALFFFLMEREIFISLYSGLVDYSSRISLTHTHTHTYFTSLQWCRRQEIASIPVEATRNSSIPSDARVWIIS